MISFLFLFCCFTSASSPILTNSRALAELSPLADFITGPHYIFPLPPEVVINTGYPAAIGGSCIKGTVYTVTSVDDLIRNLDQLECIYQGGQVPNAIPLGIHYGSVLKFGTSDSLVELFLPFWSGKVASLLRCPSDDLHLVLNVIQGRVRVSAIMSIGVPNIKLAKGEYSDGQPTLIIDYSKQLGDMCQTPPGSIFTRDDLSLDFLENIYPFRLVVDVVRAVGRQADGGVIYLGKTYVQDPFRADRQAYNIAFWSVVNYDPSVTNFNPGDSLSPLLRTFMYSEPGAFQGFALMFPVDNLVVDPATTLERLFGYYEAFTKLISNRLGLDLRRSIDRIPTLHFKTLMSGIEFLTFKISWILSRNPSLDTTGITAESAVAEILDRSISNGETMDSDTGKTKLWKTRETPASEDIRQKQRFNSTVPLLKGLVDVLFKSSSKIPETVNSKINNTEVEYQQQQQEQHYNRELSNVLPLASNLLELLSRITKNQEL